MVRLLVVPCGICIFSITIVKEMHDPHLTFTRPPNVNKDGTPMSDCLGLWGKDTKPLRECTVEVLCDMCKAWGKVLGDLREKKKAEPKPEEEIPF
jgi:hypothetical protein